MVNLSLGSNNLGQMCGPIKGEVCFGCLACGAGNDAWLVFKGKIHSTNSLGSGEAGSAGEVLPKEALMSAPPLAGWDLGQARSMTSVGT